MKRILLSLVLTFSVIIAAAQTPNAPEIEFMQTEYDFGDVPHNSKSVECEFEFVNTGTAPLVIVKTVTSCTCTRATFDKRPIQPGERSKIIVSYEPQKKEAGVFYKAVDVYTNALSSKRQTITVKGRAVDK